MTENKGIFSLLFEAKILTPLNITLLKGYVTKWKVSEFQAILDTNILNETDLVDRLSKLLKINKYNNLYALDISKKAAALLDYKIAKKYECLPIEIINKSTIKVIFSDPTNVIAIDAVKKETGKKIIIAIANKSEILNTIEEVYSAKDHFTGIVKERIDNAS